MSATDRSDLASRAQSPASKGNGWTLTSALTRDFRSLEGSLGAAWRVSAALGVRVVVVATAADAWRIVPATWDQLPAASPVAVVEAIEPPARENATLSES